MWWEIRDLSPSLIPNKIFFAIFHAVSAFCNAGFSTLTGNLYHPGIRDLYGLQCWIATLIILGGIGFPILFNYGKLVNHKVRNLFYRLPALRAWPRSRIVNTTTRIVITATLLPCEELYFLVV
ncbi:MAG: potassium transporter TrkG [Odoribacter splanchnicus]